ncbi:uncharacterized protein MONBRDRAFT_23020 [Monosiga brevicollis MX1]|uniref:Transmembrane protein n=1 Tax=Monosiga brevicollis TaxID=81824 RepID=A9USS3_MONBE|nr:uncharacterized protein MONBRDRAFT_23020 [Monosiga brevicollis MX1]EDQ91829.1 predicted protein [Monosiga brevicollis MX1]|eukprot:XP_001743115.1 hypothetical protein [Monosiga brevicollis MX1]
MLAFVAFVAVLLGSAVQAVSPSGSGTSQANSIITVQTPAYVSPEYQPEPCMTRALPAVQYETQPISDFGGGTVLGSSDIAYAGSIRDDLFVVINYDILRITRNSTKRVHVLVGEDKQDVDSVAAQVFELDEVHYILHAAYYINGSCVLRILESFAFHVLYQTTVTLERTMDIWTLQAVDQGNIMSILAKDNRAVVLLQAELTKIVVHTHDYHFINTDAALTMRHQSRELQAMLVVDGKVHYAATSLPEARSAWGLLLEKLLLDLEATMNLEYDLVVDQGNFVEDVFLFYGKTQAQVAFELRPSSNQGTRVKIYSEPGAISATGIGELFGFYILVDGTFHLKAGNLSSPIEFPVIERPPVVMNAVFSSNAAIHVGESAVAYFQSSLLEQRAFLHVRSLVDGNILWTFEHDPILAGPYFSDNYVIAFTHSTDNTEQDMLVFPIRPDFTAATDLDASWGSAIGGVMDPTTGQLVITCTKEVIKLNSWGLYPMALPKYGDYQASIVALSDASALTLSSNGIQHSSYNTEKDSFERNWICTSDACRLPNQGAARFVGVCTDRFVVASVQRSRDTITAHVASVNTTTGAVLQTMALPAPLNGRSLNVSLMDAAFALDPDTCMTCVVFNMDSTVVCLDAELNATRIVPRNDAPTAVADLRIPQLVIHHDILLVAVGLKAFGMTMAGTVIWTFAPIVQAARLVPDATGEAANVYYFVLQMGVALFQVGALDVTLGQVLWTVTSEPLYKPEFEHMLASSADVVLMGARTVVEGELHVIMVDSSRADLQVLQRHPAACEMSTFVKSYGVEVFYMLNCPGNASQLVTLTPLTRSSDAYHSGPIPGYVPTTNGLCPLCPSGFVCTPNATNVQNCEVKWDCPAGSTAPRSHLWDQLEAHGATNASMGGNFLGLQGDTRSTTLPTVAIVINYFLCIFIIWLLYLWVIRPRGWHRILQSAFEDFLFFEDTDTDEQGYQLLVIDRLTGYGTVFFMVMTVFLAIYVLMLATVGNEVKRTDTEPLLLLKDGMPSFSLTMVLTAYAGYGFDCAGAEVILQTLLDRALTTEAITLVDGACQVRYSCQNCLLSSDSVREQMGCLAVDFVSDQVNDGFFMFSSLNLTIISEGGGQTTRISRNLASTAQAPLHNVTLQLTTALYTYQASSSNTYSLMQMADMFAVDASRAAVVRQQECALLAPISPTHHDGTVFFAFSVSSVLVTESLEARYSWPALLSLLVSLVTSAMGAFGTAILVIRVLAKRYSAHRRRSKELLLNSDQNYATMGEEPGV